ncbi:hypothetical protein [Leptospira sp. GIMC2001]|uniref:hypothetical protein n=1 Tax=Leptospira sp. GIMC2001 TaxID=1513297 RepID=UPI002349F550|nr:hypothetical protein [Leptospira sp. GIMC2001]WCL49045.1 hypothetical protein O4O04_17410 [Leptospira sp. GIMC2001]
MCISNRIFKNFAYLIVIFSLVTECSVLNDVPILGDIAGTKDEEQREEDERNLLILLAAAASGGGSTAGGVTSCANLQPVSPGGTVNSLASGDTSFRTGYAQVTSNNQDAFVQRLEGGSPIWCYYYDRSAADTRGERILYSNNELFVAFTTDGGNADFRTTANAVQNSYGRGGGPKVIYLARLNLETGAIVNATYLGARLNDGRTNTTSPQFLEIVNSRIRITLNTAYDAGAASDSLDPGKICDSGSSRTIELPFTLDSITSINCSKYIN